TTIKAPIAGTVTKLRSQQGERVVGTAMMAGTEIMTIADLDRMEARVDIGEIDVVLIKLGQKARLEVEAFRDRKSSGIVTETANAANAAASTTTTESSPQRDASKAEPRIRNTAKHPCRPGMSVTAQVAARSRTTAAAVSITAVTARLPKGAEKEEPKEEQ